jgi:hypothetical protein
MTGYKSKKAAASAKTIDEVNWVDHEPDGRRVAQWDTPSEAFNDWWDSDYDDSTNPYERDSFAYWAWAGWQAALAQEKNNGT